MILWNDLHLEPMKRECKGQQPTMAWNGVRVKHLPSGLIVEVPHEMSISQRCNIEVAVSMIEAGMAFVNARRASQSALTESEIDRALYVQAQPTEQDEPRRPWE